MCSLLQLNDLISLLVKASGNKGVARHKLLVRRTDLVKRLRARIAPRVAIWMVLHRQLAVLLLNRTTLGTRLQVHHCIQR